MRLHHLIGHSDMKFNFLKNITPFDQNEAIIFFFLYGVNYNKKLIQTHNIAI